MKDGGDSGSNSSSGDRLKVSLVCENWVLTNTNQSSSESERGNIAGNKIKVEVRRDSKSYTELCTGRETRREVKYET